MQRLEHLRRYFAGTTAVLAVLCAGVTQADTSQPVKAVWQVQELHLSYMGFTSRYSCDGMRDKVAAWLDQLGVQNSRVTIAGCDRSTGPAHLPSVRVLLATPVAATSEAAAASQKDDKRAANLAKLQSKSKAPLSDTTFDATRKTVTLRSKDTMAVGSAGDCELLENFRDQVLKKIDAKITQDQLGCTPHQGTVGNPSLVVDILSKA